MIRSIVGASLKFRFLAIVIAAALISFGVAQLRNMPVDVLPEFSPPYVEIQTEALGLSAEEVEQLITVPLEQDLLNGVAWLDSIRSESVPGLSSIILFFEPGTDLYRARQMVAERLTQAFALPHVSKAPGMLQPLSSTSRFLIVGLSSKEVSLIEMGVLARWTIGPRLMGVPGVANVAIWGQRERQLQVQVDPERLRAQGVSLQQVLETTGNALWVSSLTFLEASTPGTGGFVDTPQQRLGIWHVLPISSPQELAQVPVDGAPGLRLGDVTDVVEDHQPLIGDAMINEDQGYLLVIEKSPGANTLEVTRGVEAALDVLRPGLAGIEIDTTFFRPATFIEMALANLTRLLLIAAVLVVLVLLAFLWSWRVALTSLVAIVLSLFAAVFVLYLLGATLNTMVLLGLMIALGVIVDDAIIDSENVMQRFRLPRQEDAGKSRQILVLEALVEMRSAMFFATLIVLLTILPIFFLRGVSGSFFRPLALATAAATLTSMAVALLITPAMSLILLSGVSPATREPRQPLLARWLQAGYGRVLASVMRRQVLVYGVLGIILLAGLAAAPFLRQESLLPSFKEVDLTIQLEGAPGTSRPEMDRITARASGELRAIPGVRNVGVHVGRAVLGDQVVGIDSAQLWVSIDPAADYDATVAAVQEVMDGYVGLGHEVSTYLQQTLRHALTGASEAIVARVYGEDSQVLRDKAEQIKQAAAGIPGVVDLRVELPVLEPTLELQVDLAAAQRYGVKPGDVRRAAATLLSGLQVGSLFEEQKVFDVVVWGKPETRGSLTSIHDLLIDTPSGGHVRLDEVADVRIASSPSAIQREGASHYVDVAFNVQGRDLGSVVNDVKLAIRKIEFPLEYHAEVIGEYAERQTAQQRILLAVIIATIGVFLLLQAALDSWRLASVALLALPVALAGGVLAAFAGGRIISLGSLVGFLTLSAIAVRNGIMLMNHYRYLERQEGMAFGPALILRGSKERLAPMLTTALATAVAFAPFALAGNIPGNELVRPMAGIVLGGLVTSTLVSLFLVPVLYRRFGTSPQAVTSQATEFATT